MFDCPRLQRWAIEVDQDRTQANYSAQQDFIRDFGRILYDAMKPGAVLDGLRYVYFTRIFYPSRDNMGAYVRLHFCADSQRMADHVNALDKALAPFIARGQVFSVRKDDIDPLAEAGLKGSAFAPELYYRYMEHISRAAVATFSGGASPAELSVLPKEWAHNLFNLFWGQSPI